MKRPADGGRRTSETGRLEAFSDAVFAIALTLLVLDLRPPDGDFTAGLLRDWEGYVAYLVAFVTIGSIWLSHHDAFTRIRRADPTVLALNLCLLLGASLVPWPTALMSAAVLRGSPSDETASILVYSIVTLLIGLPWTALNAYLAKRPHLLESPDDAVWLCRAARRNSGTVLLAAAGAALGLVAPIASLGLYLVVPLLFIVLTLRADGGPGSP